MRALRLPPASPAAAIQGRSSRAAIQACGGSHRSATPPLLRQVAGAGLSWNRRRWQQHIHTALTRLPPRSQHRELSAQRLAAPLASLLAAIPAASCGNGKWRDEIRAPRYHLQESCRPSRVAPRWILTRRREGCHRGAGAGSARVGSYRVTRGFGARLRHDAAWSRQRERRSWPGRRGEMTHNAACRDKNALRAAPRYV